MRPGSHHRVARFRGGAADLAVEVAYAAVLRFAEQGYPGASARDPDDFLYEVKVGQLEAAKAAVASAGLPLADPAITDAVYAGMDSAVEAENTATVWAYEGGGGSEEARIVESWSNARKAAPRLLATARRSVTRLPLLPQTRGRSRAARCAAPRRRGSRRAGAGSRAGPDDGDGESDPPGIDGPHARGKTAEARW